MSQAPDRPGRAIVPADCQDADVAPLESAEAPVVNRTVLAPRDPSDPPSRFRRFVTFLRDRFALKSLELVRRWAEAKVAEKEIDNQKKILDAKKEFELGMAQVRALDLKSAAEAEDLRAAAEEKRAKAKLIRAQSRSESAKARELESQARLDELAERHIRTSAVGPEAAREWLDEVIAKIEFQHGGRVEIQLPPPPDEEADDRVEGQ